MKSIEIEELKKIQLEMLDYIHNFCVEHNIVYWLVYGTLIGAIRHNGYIPWDDDIDIAMPRKDYDRFFKEFKHSYYEALNCDNCDKYLYFFGKVYDQRTVLKEHNNFKLETGIFIDVFPIDNMPDDIIKREEHCHKMSKLIHYHNIKKNRLFGYKRGFKKTLMFALAKPVGLFYSTSSLVKKMDHVMQSYNNVDTQYGSYMGHTRVTPVRKPYETVLHVFEDREYMIPRDYDEWLTCEYGDYMTPPSEEGKLSTHVFTAWWK